MTQKDRIKKYIDDFGGITAAQAAADLGVMYLSGRIKDLRRDGVPVVAVPRVGINRYGDKVRYHEYTIKV
jgi:hypothetical protein